jgi:MSHA biogenesis protein MshN
LSFNEGGKFPELQLDFLYKNSLTENHNAVGPIQNGLIKKLSYNSSSGYGYQRAMSLARQGQVDEAINELSQFLEKQPGFNPARELLITLLLKQGNIVQAQEEINFGLQKKPVNPKYIQMKAQILVDSGQIKEALNVLQSATPPFEDNLEYYSLIAALYQRQNKFDLAEKLYDRLIHQQANNSIWWMGLGIARESLEKNREAIEAYQKANTDSLSPELKVYVETRIHALQG